MDDLDSRDVEPLLDAQQPATDQLVKGSGRHARIAQCAPGAVQRDALPVPRIAEEPILDKGTERFRFAGETAFVKALDDVVAAAGEKLGVDLIEPASDAAFVQFAANQAQQWRLDLKPLGRTTRGIKGIFRAGAA